MHLLTTGEITQASRATMRAGKRWIPEGHFRSLPDQRYQVEAAQDGQT